MHRSIRLAANASLVITLAQLTPPGPALATGSSGPTGDELRDFDFVVATVRDNYAGWETKVTDETRPALDSLTAGLRKRAERAGPGEGLEIAKEWIAFFHDRHLGIAPGAPGSAGGGAPGSGGAPSDSDLARLGPRMDWTEDLVRARLAARTDPIEGIWESVDGNYRVGLLPRTDGPAGFAAVVLASKSPAWSAGQIKFELDPGREGRYAARYSMRDHSARPTGARLMTQAGLLLFDGVGIWKRSYPEAPAGLDVDRLAPSPAFFLRRLSPATLWLRLPDFDLSHRAVLDSLLQAHDGELREAPNLIIDLRNNGGGSDFTYADILPWLYTRPIYELGAQFRATPANVTKLVEAMSDPAFPADVRKAFEPLIERMRAHPGEWVAESDRPFSIRTFPEVRKFPRRVGVLIDNAASSGEQFILAARQSRKVTLFGQRNSAGVLDYANVILVPLPSGRGQLHYPTSRSMRLPEEPVDPDGIAPDVLIPAEAEDPVGFAMGWLERQAEP